VTRAAGPRPRHLDKDLLRNPDRHLTAVVSLVRAASSISERSSLASRFSCRLRPCKKQQAGSARG
jgi:hypothetical protein